MSYIIASFIAILVYYANKIVCQKIGILAVVTYSPFIEEAAKTLIPYFLNTSILITHIVFGFIEGVYDYLKSFSLIGIKAAVISIGGHTVFGLITITVISMTESVILAVLLTGLTHLAWNRYIIIHSK